ncbi:MAG: DUF58 domain-containing protein [Alphaproteobacteria bacterium]|nr:DUF58 domain-containing protein [Alphaproteobacteria bacterium]
MSDAETEPESRRQGGLPDIRQRAERLAERLPPLLVAAERVAVTVAQGVHGRRRVGVGETFWQFRPYQQGEPTTRIDWRQSARSSQLFLRDQEWEAAESVWLWADGSGSMDYRSDQALPTKDDRALLLVLALAALLVRAGERIALLGSARRPAGGRAGLQHFCDQLVEQADHRGNLPKGQALPHYARIVMISDFFTSIDELKSRLRGFAGLGVRGHLLQVLDPAEEDLPFNGRVRFDDIERSDQRALIGNVDSVRQRYQQRFRAHVDGVFDVGRALGWTVAAHRTENPPEPALLGLYNALAGTVQG